MMSILLNGLLLMRRRALLMGLTLAPAGAPAGGHAAAPLAVVASFSVLADMARRVGGALVSVASLVPADTDAHAFQPTAADSRALATASVFIENGLGLEGWITRLGVASGFRGTRIVASTGVVPRMVRDGAAASRDPHAWQDPRNGVLYARAIAEGLAAADPVHADTYRASAAAYGAEIAETDAWIASRFAPVPVERRRIITTHDAFGYYGARYGIAFLAAQGMSADAEPSAKGIAALIGQMKREKIRTVFLENMTDPRLGKMLAREAGATLSGPLFSDALSAPDGPAPDYLAMLRHNTALFERALRDVV